MEILKYILIPIKSHVQKMKIVEKKHSGVPKYYGWVKKMLLHLHMGQLAIIGIKKYVQRTFHLQVLTITTMMLVILATSHNFGVQIQKGEKMEILQSS